MSLEKSCGQGHWSDDGKGGGAWFAFFTARPAGAAVGPAIKMAGIAIS